MNLESLTAADSATWIPVLVEEVKALRQSPKHVIVSKGFGSFSAWDATVENAKEILSWQSIPQEVKDFAETKPERWTTFEAVERIIEKMLTKDVGTIAFESRDGSVTIPITAEAKAETVLYLFQKGIAPKEFSSYSLKTQCRVTDLSWLSHFHDVTLVDEWITDWASKLRTINGDKYKEGIPEWRKVRFIIQFINELCHRDEEYDVVELKAAKNS